MIFLKSQILSVLIVNLFYFIKCTPVYNLTRNVTDYEDLIVVDLTVINQLKSSTLTDTDDYDSIGSGDGEIILNLKSPLTQFQSDYFDSNQTEINEDIDAETVQTVDRATEAENLTLENTTNTELNGIYNSTYLLEKGSNDTEVLEATFDQELGLVDDYMVPENKSTGLFLQNRTVMEEFHDTLSTIDSSASEDLNLNTTSLDYSDFNSTLISNDYSENIESTALNDIETPTNSTEETLTSTELIPFPEESTTITSATTNSSCPPLNCESATFLSQIVDYEDIYELYISPATCNFGRIKNTTTGCDTCDCAKDPQHMFKDMCVEPFCLKSCYYGSYKDANGCDTCACRSRPLPKSVFECPKLNCPICNYGAIKDEFGCQTCVCYRPNSKETSHSCPSEPQCPYGACLYGSVLNDFGCPTCDCLKSTDYNRKECPMVRCLPCKNGYFTDASGCNTCMCKPDSASPCTASNYTCDRSKCTHGTYLDRNGCSSCECLPDPSSNGVVPCFEKRENEGTKIDLNHDQIIFPQCRENKPNEYKPKMCNHKECVCLTPNGHQISDFKAPLENWFEMHCECARLLYRMSVNREIGYKLFCQENGNFEDIQCSGSTCGCVTHFGHTYGPSVPMHQKHLLRCYDIYERIFTRNAVQTTLPPTTLSPPLCIYHRERAQEMMHFDRHIPVPRCDNNGLYEPVQCDRNVKYCWCVNIHNGVELYGTSRTGNLPDCLRT